VVTYQIVSLVPRFRLSHRPQNRVVEEWFISLGLGPRAREFESHLFYKNRKVMINGTLYIDNFVDNSDYLFNLIRDTSDWDRRMASRLTTSFGVSYDYSGISYPDTSIPDYLSDIVNRIRDTIGFTPNNCLVNYYLDGRSKMGYHSDRTDILLPGTGVVIVSLGSTRILRFRNINDKDDIIDFSLKSGSLFYMTADVQDLWVHSIPTSDTDDGRMSLTFRSLNPPTV
jgi:hypothetical protein